MNQRKWLKAGLCWSWFSSLILSVLLLVVITVATHAIPLYFFRVPRTHISNLELSFSYQFYDDRFLDDRSNLNVGHLGLTYFSLFNSPHFGYSLTGNADLELRAQDPPLIYRIITEGNVNYFFDPRDLFFGFAGFTGRGASVYRVMGLLVSLGAGYGRFTDVTPLAQAVRIEARLRARGSLVEPLSYTDLLAIAHIIGRRYRYVTLADLLTSLQARIEWTLKTRPDGLDTLDIYIIAAILEDRRFKRFSGWDIRFGLGYELLDPFEGERDLVAISAFNIAFAPEPGSQLVLRGSFTGARDLLRTHSMSIRADYHFLWTEIIDLRGSYTFSRDSEAGFYRHRHQIDLGIVVRLPGDTDITLTLALMHGHDYEEWSKRLLISLNMDLF
ncbi:hypothetical protein LM597_02740 [Candidatus Acetothermia bacterium]|nr:hypothetical protein [Candidatus Acetothermia bacterium]